MTPVAAWLSLTNNLITGGSITIGTGLNWVHAGTYTLVLTNSYIGQTDKTDSMTLIIEDPCKSAVFETSPNPFSNVSIAVSATSILNTTFKIWTDKERSNANVICPIKATFTTSPAWVPISVMDPYLKHQVNPSLFTLPGDIGAHTISIKIESPRWPANVTLKTYTFTVTVTCDVTVFALTTAVTNFSYILNSGNVLKGPFNTY
jgi:hypothetical protein